MESVASSAKLIALYFPQFHSIPENDEWWGEGFTDWVNVKSAKPNFDNHYQPRVPLDQNYYDQSQLTTLRWQIDLAKSHGVYGFCHYHYWFDGKQLLETPTNLLLENPDLDIPFCLSWANETWSRRWDGRDHHILIKQTHPPDEGRWKRHFDYLIRAWSDDRAIKVDGKPVFVIYRPHRIPKVDRMLEYWRDLARQEGLKGLYFIAQKQYEFPRRECLKRFDAVFQFQPFEAMYSNTHNSSSMQGHRLFRLIRALPDPLLDRLRSLRSRMSERLRIHEYDDAWSAIIERREEPGMTTFPGAFVDWDNTARYGKRATIFRNASPDKFSRGLRELISNLPNRNLPEPFIFLNAWNEWSESAYLEPDQRYGLSYLEALRAALLDTQVAQ